MPLSLPQPSPEGNPEAGFTLVQVLVSLGILSLCTALFFQARSTAHKARKSVEAASTIGDVNAVFVSELTAIIRGVNASPGCLNYAAQITNRPLTKSAGTAALTFTRNVNQAQFIAADLDSSSRTSLQSQFGLSPLQTTINRCRNPQQPAQTTQANSIFYLCMNISKDASAPVGTFLNAPFAFAEVGWQLINLQTGAGVSCANFVAGGKEVGARVFYSVNWAVPMNGMVTMKKHINSFIMGK